MATISADAAAASSSKPERDARLASSEPGRVAPGEIALGVIIGRTSEFFDFFVFGLACVLVFPRLVFPWADAVTGTLYSFGLFALAFVARPIGSVLFMAIDRRYGRATKLTIALFLLGLSTCLIAFLPGYETIGHWSAVLLGLCRIGQGLALGGAWDGLASLLALNAPKTRRGWYAMLPQLGAPVGFMLASGLFAFFQLQLSDADFMGFGWRYPFFVAFTINVVACSRAFASSRRKSSAACSRPTSSSPSRSSRRCGRAAATSWSAPSCRWPATPCSTSSRYFRSAGSTCSPAARSASS